MSEHEWQSEPENVCETVEEIRRVFGDNFEILFYISPWKHKWATTWQNQQNECAPSEDSDQPVHPPSLIRVFAVCMKKPWVLSYPLSSEDSDQTGRMPRLIWVFAGCTIILLVLSCCGHSFEWPQWLKWRQSLNQLSFCIQGTCHRCSPQMT